MKEKKEKGFICIITNAEDKKVEAFNADGMNHAALIVSELIKKLPEKPESVTISRVKETVGIDLDKVEFYKSRPDCDIPDNKPSFEPEMIPENK